MKPRDGALGKRCVGSIDVYAAIGTDRDAAQRPDDDRDRLNAIARALYQLSRDRS